MGYAEFNPNVKKVNLKPKGEVEIVLTTYLSDLRGNVETLSDMIDQKVHIALESTVVTYNVQINSRTEKPIKSYRVDESGVVSEVKPEGEQMELNLGIPKKEDPIEEIPQEIDQKIVDDFILALLAPDYSDMPYPFYAWLLELREGGTYMRIAFDYGMSSGKVSELLDEYRSRVAPLAARWDEWMQGKVESVPTQTEEKVVAETTDEGTSDQEEPSEYEQEVLNEMDKQGTPEIPDWMREGTGEHEMSFTDDKGSSLPENDNSETGESTGDEVEISKEKLEEFILQERPSFPDVDLDFPSLVEKRRDGATWLGLSKELGIPSSQLNTKFKKYKDHVKKLMKDNGAA